MKQSKAKLFSLIFRTLLTEKYQLWFLLHFITENITEAQKLIFKWVNYDKFLFENYFRQIISFIKSTDVSLPNQSLSCFLYSFTRSIQLLKLIFL